VERGVVLAEVDTLLTWTLRLLLTLIVILAILLSASLV
jgi:hypothetical protein